MKKRKICFIITSEIHYARGKLILKALRARKDVELQIVVGASALLLQYGNILPILKRDGFSCASEIVMTVEGGNPIAMAKTAGLGVVEFAGEFSRLKPDIVVIRGDRYEVLSIAIAAVYLNIPVAHIEGGDVTGTIDESVRHAVTKLAHLHFPTNESSRRRLVRMGENPRFIFNVGSPEIEILAQNKKNWTVDNKFINYLGVGDAVDVRKPYIVVMHHPVTTEYGANRKNTEIVLHAVNECAIPTIWFWPNIDAGTDEVSKAIRVFRENKKLVQKIRFIKYLPPEEFYSLLSLSRCLVGNSSSGIKECSYLGVPVVNIGTRQHGRARGYNVIDVEHNKKAIKRALHAQIKHGTYKMDNLYYKKETSVKIAAILAKKHPPIQKCFID